MQQILINLKMRSFYVIFGARARLCFDNLSEPICWSIIDGLSNVASKVKSRVVGSRENEHKLVWLVFHFGNFELRVQLLKKIWVN